MKKQILLLLIIFLITGCGKEIVEIPPKEKNIPDETIPVEVYKDDNPIVVGLYMNGKLVSEYTTRFVDDKDIVSLEHLGTNFYLTEEDVGKKTITEASLQKLKNLNPFTNN